MSGLQHLNRREFFSLTGKAGGVLLLGSSAPVLGDGHVKDASDTGLSDLGVFVSLDAQGNVEIVCQRMEMGQGILTSTPQLIAEELCADWDKVTAVLGEANPAYGDQSTGGSKSIRSFWEHTRKMGAVARTMLEQAAANRWSVDVSEVKAQNHKVINIATGESIDFGELANDAAQLEVPEADTVTLKPVSEFTLVGKDVALQGLEDIVMGKAVYAQDIQLPDMLIASIQRPPVVGGKVKSFDDSEAKKVAGVVDVIRLKDRPLPVVVNPVSGVAVLATNTWAAHEGRKKLKIEWDLGDNASHNTDAYKQELVKKVNQKAKSIRSVGDVYDHEYNPERTLELTYTVPYHHHMSMETPAATAHVTDEGTTVWSGTQSPQWGKSLVLAELGLDPEKDWGKVTFNTTLMGGAFGRKGKNDFTLEAVELSQVTGKAVKVVWTREDDVKHGFYHAIAANYFKAELNQKNSADYWLQRLAAPPIYWIFDDKNKHLSDVSLSLGFGDVPFDVPNMEFENAEVDTHVRIGWVRAVGNINNQFGLGSFVDELAVKAGVSTKQMWFNLFGKDRIVDPRKEGFEDYTYYEQIEDEKPKPEYLLDIARFKAVLNEVIDKSGAEQAVDENQGWGISIGYSFNSYVAAATKVQVVDNQVEVLEMHTAIDCGLVVTPDRVRSQMEGAMIMGLSMTLESEITVKDGAIVQNNFYDYPVSRINKVPPMYVHLIESDKAPGGVGEPGLPPILPSITNAIFHASGVRVRDLPVSKTMKV